MNKKKSTEDKYVTYLRKWSCIVKEWNKRMASNLQPNSKCM